MSITINMDWDAGNEFELPEAQDAVLKFIGINYLTNKEGQRIEPLNYKITLQIVNGKQPGKEFDLLKAAFNKDGKQNWFTKKLIKDLVKATTGTVLEGNAPLPTQIMVGKLFSAKIVLEGYFSQKHQKDMQKVELENIQPVAQQAAAPVQAQAAAVDDSDSIPF